MHTDQILKKLSELEAAGQLETVLLLVPLDDGCYEAVDQHHKGQIFTEATKDQHKGVVLIWDL